MGFGFNTTFPQYSMPPFGFNGLFNNAKTETEEEKKERVRKETDHKAAEELRTKLKEYDENLKKMSELQKLKPEADATKKELIKQKKQISIQTNAFRNAKVNSDGSAEVLVNLNTIKQKEGKLALWKRGALNVLNGTFNVLKSLAGYDNKTKKWDPVKCLRNVGIAVGAGALCAAAGPVGGAIAAKLGGGLIATAIGAGVSSIPTVLAGAGVAAGGIMTYKAVKKLDKAIESDDTQKFDKATQDIGAGLTIGISSITGVRSIGKGAGVWTKGKGVIGNIGSFLKNTFINPVKGTWENTITARDAVLAARDAARSTNATKGYFARNWGNFKGYFKGMKDANVKLGTQKAELAKQKFEEAFNSTVSKIQNQICECDIKLAVCRTNGDVKGAALYNMQKMHFEDILTKLNDAKTYKDWTAFTKLLNGQLKEINGYRKNYYGFNFGGRKFWKKEGTIEVNGQKFDNADSNFARDILQEIRKSQKDINKSVREVRHQKIETMYEMGKKKVYNKEVKDFGFSTNGFWRKIPLIQNPINIFKKEIYKWKDISHNKMETIAGHGFMLFDPIFVLNHYVGDKEAMPLHLMMLEQPYYEASEKTLLSAEELAQAKADYEEAEKQIQAKIDECDKILNATA